MWELSTMRQNTTNSVHLRTFTNAFVAPLGGVASLTRFAENERHGYSS